MRQLNNPNGDNHFFATLGTTVPTLTERFLPHKSTSTGSGCGSVGRAVISDTRGPLFESSHRLIFIKNVYLLIVNCFENTKIKIKRPGWPIKKPIVHFSLRSLTFCEMLKPLPLPNKISQPFNLSIQQLNLTILQYSTYLRNLKKS